MKRLIATFVCTAVASAAHGQPADPPTPDAPAPAPAPAPTDKDAAAARYAQGQQHFSAGEDLDAADDFEAAYALDHDPVYLYNIAQAYRLGIACARAADFYRKFL